MALAIRMQERKDERQRKGGYEMAKRIETYVVILNQTGWKKDEDNKTFYERSQCKGMLTLYEAEDTGKKYIAFSPDSPEDGYHIFTSYNHITIVDEVIFLSTKENTFLFQVLKKGYNGSNLYHMKPLLNPFQCESPKFLHICECCGKKEYLTSQEAFEQGWDYPGKDGIYTSDPAHGFGMLAPRICGNCSTDQTLSWRVNTGQVSLKGELTEKDQKTLERITNEPFSLI